MRNYCFKMSLTKILASLLLAATLAGCGDNAPSAGTTTTTVTPTPTAPAGLALGTSANFILTDNATAATLTATLVDSSNAVMPGIPVSFATTTGNLNASSATTDANGQAIVLLRSGLAEFFNRTATVTATVAGQSASIPILIRGSTVALAVTPSTTIQVGAGTITATATAATAAGLGLSNVTIRFSIGATSTGAATLSATTLTTDVSGVTPPLTFTPTAAGTVVLTAEWLDSAGAVTSTATKDIFVTPAAGLAFAITTPASDPVALTTGSTQSLIATVPATIAGGTVATVRISATSGNWTGTSPAAAGISILQTPAGAVSATYTAPTNSGTMTVQVDALDASGTALGTLTRTFVISAPSSDAAMVFLSPSVSTIVPSSGGNISTSTLEATVRDSNYNSVGGAAVMFGLLGTTGSGESVSPAVVITDSSGKATTTFTAGSSSTLGAIYAQARLLAAPLPCTGALPDPVVTETNPMCDSAPMMVSADAVSVTVGFGSTVLDTANATQYKLPGSVLVVNSNGSPVAGATVTLSAFPIAYRNGLIYASYYFSTSNTLIWKCSGPVDTSSAPVWDPIIGKWTYLVETGFTNAEDINRNGILDNGEDTPAPALQTASQLAAQAVSSNGLLSPPQAAGGTVPLTVTTDENGAATFYLQYPKSSAWFINDEVTARVIVMGTESSAKTTLTLPMSETDKFDPICPLGREASY